MHTDHARAPSSPWLLALESSTPFGGAALLRDGACVEAIRLEEGLRHGRELVSSAARLLERHGLAAADLRGAAVSAGPGSYTGLRVGVMAAKALAYGAGIALACVSSLEALAQTAAAAGAAAEGDTVFALQDARRDEVYAGEYRIQGGFAVAAAPDAAITPEEAAARLRALRESRGGRLRCAGGGFATYGDVFAGAVDAAGAAGCGVDPAAVGVLGWRRLAREESADPMQAQPVYLRRDAGVDWRHDHLVANTWSATPLPAKRFKFAPRNGR